MKYEITQGHYAAFLNTLSDDDTFERFSFGGRTYFKKRGTIYLDEDRYIAGSPRRPLNFLSWDEDWPHDYGAEGHGYRGGGFYDQGRSVSDFNPYSPIAYRRFGGWAGSYPYRAYGFRCVRTAGS